MSAMSAYKTNKHENGKYKTDKYLYLKILKRVANIEI